MGPKKKGSGVGQALLRHRFNRAKGFENSDPARLHTTEILDSAPALQSIIDRNDLDELLYTAEMAGRDFTAERGSAQVIVSTEDTSGFGNLGKQEKRQQQLEEEALYSDSLKIPRRPAWHSGMSAEQLDLQERNAFLHWRRSLVSLEENEKLVLTPFEKNLDLWRQLWRVLERSDLVVTVVDSRNPMLYRCPDLEAYMNEIDSNKRSLLLLNKADLLPAAVRRKWADYLTEKGIRFAFWSAKQATAVLEGKALVEMEEEGHSDAATAVLGREGLLNFLQQEAASVVTSRSADSNLAAAGDDAEEDAASRRVVVGFVGYPNVGKSSTINALVGQKKTGVTSTPGKTKHFQTLIISPTLMLCDCPGLVFPSFSSSRSEMVAAGVLPIDRITDHRGPVEVVTEQIPRAQLEAIYGFKLPRPAPHEPQDRPPTAAELLRAYAQSRGYVASSGLPDETRASRYILKDYLSGRLLYFHLPPNESREGQGSAAIAGYGSGVQHNNSGSDAQSSADDDEEGEWEEIHSDSDGSGDDTGPTPDLEEPSVKPERGASTALAEADVALGDRHQPGEATEVRSSVPLEELIRMGDEEALRRAPARKPVAASHKMHKKTARRKDRTWRVGHGGVDDSDGMPMVRGILQDVSHGAALRTGVRPSEAPIIASMSKQIS